MQDHRHRTRPMTDREFRALVEDLVESIQRYLLARTDGHRLRLLRNLRLTMAELEKEPPMTDREFRKLVQEMMDAQKAYFHARRKGLPGSVELGESKALESLVRKELSRDQSGQGTLPLG